MICDCLTTNAGCMPIQINSWCYLFIATMLTLAIWIVIGVVYFGYCYIKTTKIGGIRMRTLAVLFFGIGIGRINNPSEWIFYTMIGFILMLYDYLAENCTRKKVKKK